MKPSLFQKKNFLSAGGLELDWKIECNVLTSEDWACLAYIAATYLLPSFGKVEGVPSGGFPFAAALEEYIDPTSDELLICDDVYTTGFSMDKHRAHRGARGIVAFARNPISHNHPWITPVFQLSKNLL